MVAIQTVHMYGSADKKPFYKVSMTIVKCVKDSERVLTHKKRSRQAKRGWVFVKSF